MPPFKRTTAKFTGDASITGRNLERYHGQQVTIVKSASPGANDETDDWAVRFADGKTECVEGDDLSPHPESAETNQEMMARLMEWCSTPMVHAFIFDAIDKQAKAVLADPDATRAAFGNGIVHPDAWMAAAKEAQTAVNAHLGQ